MDLIIDGNALLNVTTNVIVYGIRNSSNFDLSYIMVDNKMILKESSRQMFRNFMLKYLTGIIAPLQQALTNIFFTFDSVSWRKFYIEKYFERHAEIPGFTYKGHRKTDDHKRELFMFFDYFKNTMMPELTALTGIHEIRIKGCEGDDVIAILNEIITGDKIIWTVDSDMSQLVKYDGHYTIVLGSKDRTTKRRKLVLPLGYDKPMNLLDFNMGNFSLGGLVDRLVTEKEYDPLIIEPKDFTLRKLIMGDLQSDNIPGLYVKVSPTGRRMGITNKHANSILSMIESEFEKDKWLEYIDAKDEKFISKVVESTLTVMKLPEEEKQNITDCFGLNSRLIRLSSEMIPPQMVGMVKYEYSKLDLTKKFDYKAYREYAYIEEQ